MFLFQKSKLLPIELRRGVSWPHRDKVNSRYTDHLTLTMNLNLKYDLEINSC